MSTTITRKPEKQPKRERALPKNGAAARDLAETFSQDKPPAKSRGREEAHCPDCNGSQVVAGKPCPGCTDHIPADEPAGSAPGRDDNPTPQRSAKVAHEDTLQATAGGESREILVASCTPHPSNVRPTKEEVARIAKSYDDDGGQLEPIDVRLVDDGFQIISGETRWLAAKQKGWRHIKARVREKCDDAEAFHLLMVMNAKRRELSPIYKAQMIAEATRPLSEGGGGKTLEEAGAVYGLKDAGAASNLKRLLQLPQIWQDRVASGELPQSFARCLLPVIHAKRIMDFLDKNYREEAKHLASGEADDGVDYDWESRVSVQELINQVVDQQTRPIDAGDEFHYYGDRLKGVGSQYWSYNGHYERLFELTPKIEKQLEIVELTIEGKPLRRATNFEAYDKLQLPLIKKQVDAKNKSRASTAGAKADRKPKDKEQKKAPTKAELDRRKKEQAEQLANRIRAWRHQLIRMELIRAIDAGEDNGFRLLLAIACHRPTGVDLAELLAHSRKGKRQYELMWSEVAEVRELVDEEAVIQAMAKEALALENNDKHNPRLRFAFIDAYAADVGIDLKVAWRRLQEEKSAFLEEFYLLHNTEQLRALGREFDVHLDQAKNRDAMVKILTTRDRLLPMPKSISLVKVAKAKAPKPTTPKTKGRK